MAKAGSVVSMEATGAGTKSAVDVETLYTKQNCIGRSSGPNALFQANLRLRRRQLRQSIQRVSQARTAERRPS